MRDQSLSVAEGPTRSIWYATGSPPPRASLGRSTSTDVCVVGAGIAGLTTAYLLAKAGREVIVLDEKPVGGGETGRTSAHLASAIDDRFVNIEEKHGADASRRCYESHAAAIDLIERIAADESIECGFARVDGYLFLGHARPPDGAPDLLTRELEAAQRAGVRGVALIDRGPIATLGRCLHFPHQARFHPLRYVAGLAMTLDRLGVRIYCGTRVRKLSGAGPVRAVLDNGHEVRANFGVAATNVPTPINWTGIYLKQNAYRTYVLGLEIPRGAVPDALYWDCEDPYHYVRALRNAHESEVLLVGGADHKTGQGAGPEERPTRFERLEGWARGRFPAAGRVISRWSGQVCEPEDGVAFIGRVPRSSDAACFVITGDSGMGLTHGTLGAMLVTDQILGRVNPWESLYDPVRRPTRSVGEFVRENANAAAQLVDYVTAGDVASVDDIPRGCGAVVRHGLTKHAVYRDPQGELHRCSALCPHLKCVVHWNDVEKSWDCPCHGSRFEARGKLITGPAIDDLPAATE